MKAMIRFLLIVLAIEIALPVLLYLLRDRMIFFPAREPTAEVGLTWLQGLADVRVIRAERDDGRLLAAYDAQPRDPVVGDPVVLFFHGNAGNIAYRATLLEEIVHGTGVRFVLFDYSGFGGNEGRPSEEEVYRDGLAVYDHLVASGVEPARLVLYGESLGGAVALKVAVERPVAGVVLQSTFSSTASMALRIYPFLPLAALLSRGDFPSHRRVGELRCPVLLVHGTRDEIVPFAEGERLHSAAPPGTELWPVEGAGHNDFFEVAGPEYLVRLGKRLRSWVPAISPAE